MLGHGRQRQHGGRRGRVGTPEARTQGRAIDCGGAAGGNGSNLLFDAEAKGEEIKAKFG